MEVNPPTDVGESAIAAAVASANGILHNSPRKWVGFPNNVNGGLDTAFLLPPIPDLQFPLVSPAPALARARQPPPLPPPPQPDGTEFSPEVATSSTYQAHPPVQYSHQPSAPFLHDAIQQSAIEQPQLALVPISVSAANAAAVITAVNQSNAAEKAHRPAKRKKRKTPSASIATRSSPVPSGDGAVSDGDGSVSALPTTAVDQPLSDRKEKSAKKTKRVPKIKPPALLPPPPTVQQTAPPAAPQTPAPSELKSCKKAKKKPKSKRVDTVGEPDEVPIPPDDSFGEDDMPLDKFLLIVESARRNASRLHVQASQTHNLGVSVFVRPMNTRTASSSSSSTEDSMIPSGSALFELEGGVRRSPDGFFKWYGTHNMIAAPFAYPTTFGYLDMTSAPPASLFWGLRDEIQIGRPALNNCTVREIRARVFVFGTDDLYPGDELFCEFGDAYWGKSCIDKMSRLAFTLLAEIPHQRCTVFQMVEWLDGQMTVVHDGEERKVPKEWMRNVLNYASVRHNQILPLINRHAAALETDKQHESRQAYSKYASRGSYRENEQGRETEVKFRDKKKREVLSWSVSDKFAARAFPPWQTTTEVAIDALPPPPPTPPPPPPPPPPSSSSSSSSTNAASLFSSSNLPQPVTAEIDDPTYVSAPTHSTQPGPPHPLQQHVPVIPAPTNPVQPHVQPHTAVSASAAGHAMQPYGLYAAAQPLAAITVPNSMMLPVAQPFAAITVPNSMMLPVAQPFPAITVPNSMISVPKSIILPVAQPFAALTIPSSMMLPLAPYVPPPSIGPPPPLPQSSNASAAGNGLSLIASLLNEMEDPTDAIPFPSLDDPAPPPPEPQAPPAPQTPPAPQSPARPIVPFDSPPPSTARAAFSSPTTSITAAFASPPRRNMSSSNTEVAEWVDDTAPPSMFTLPELSSPDH